MSKSLAAGPAAVKNLSNEAKAKAYQGVNPYDGSNGGDGFVAARHLSEAGWTVHLTLIAKDLPDLWPVVFRRLDGQK